LPAMIPTGGVLAKILGVELDEHGFFKARDSILTPVDTVFQASLCVDIAKNPKTFPNRSRRLAEQLLGPLKLSKQSQRQLRLS